jgi:hypothetical protein
MWGPPVGVSGRREREGGWRRVMGRLGRVAALGYGAPDQVKEDRGRLWTFADRA